MHAGKRKGGGQIADRRGRRHLDALVYGCNDSPNKLERPSVSGTVPRRAAVASVLIRPNPGGQYRQWLRRDTGWAAERWARRAAPTGAGSCRGPAGSGRSAVQVARGGSWSSRRRRSRAPIPALILSEISSRTSARERTTCKPSAAPSSDHRRRLQVGSAAAAAVVTRCSGQHERTMFHSSSPPPTTHPGHRRCQTDHHSACSDQSTNARSSV